MRITAHRSKSSSFKLQLNLARFQRNVLGAWLE
jgi:hypothetical protein